MVLNELFAAIHLTVRALVLRNASLSGCVLSFQGRVSPVVWGLVLKQIFRQRRHNNVAFIRHIRFLLAQLYTMPAWLGSIVHLWGAHIVDVHSHGKR